MVEEDSDTWIGDVKKLRKEGFVSWWNEGYKGWV